MTVGREALVTSVEDSWQGFRASVDLVMEERVNERTSSGWTYGQMLMHIAAWHEETIRRLSIFRAEGRITDPRLPPDDLNAQSAREADGLGRDALIEALDDSFRRLLEQVRGLTDAQLRMDDHWAVAVITNNTSGHYHEHQAELEAAPGARSV
ncbi:MAG: DinB family protein [Chloroflexota bacterium]|nr:DinB family protein [Chloroflexota bacterium]